jgi:chromosomal replication initiation ATPase DnaA
MTIQQCNAAQQAIIDAVSHLIPDGYTFDVILKKVPVDTEAVSELARAREIVHLVCDFTGIEFKDMYKRGRGRVNVEARRLCCLMLKQHTQLTLSGIASMVCESYDHTDVINGMATMADYIATEPDTRDKVQALGLFIITNCKF